MADQSHGIVVVDKPAGWTSHDVVARLRRLAGTQRVGHAGTLDPMATGVLVCGVGRATRLLGYLGQRSKSYTATICLGVTTTTDDAEGEPVASAADEDVTAVDGARLAAAMAELTGEIDQVPSAVSAIKVGGVRAYVRARAGEHVALAPRRVRVARFALLTRHGPDRRLLDVEVDCSTGTYVRALARDLGARLGVGAHLTALRRTRVGPFALSTARTLDQLADEFAVLPLPAAVAAAFPTCTVDAASSEALRHGRRLPAEVCAVGAEPTGVLGPDGILLALAERTGDVVRPLIVFAPA